MTLRIEINKSTIQRMKEISLCWVLSVDIGQHFSFENDLHFTFDENLWVLLIKFMPFMASANQLLAN